MNIANLSEIIAVVANLSVFGGIVFLAIELRQNNRLLRHQSRFGYLENRTTALAAVHEDESMALVLAKASEGSSLSNAEELRLVYWHAGILARWEWEFEQFTSGDLRPPPTEVWTWCFENMPRFGQSWLELKSVHHADFVKYVDENVVPANPSLDS